MEETDYPKEQQGAIEGEDTPGVSHSTECEHYYQVAGTEEASGLTPVSCARCWGGHLVDLRLFEVRDGEIMKRT